MSSVSSQVSNTDINDIFDQNQLNQIGTNPTSADTGNWKTLSHERDLVSSFLSLGRPTLNEDNIYPGELTALTLAKQLRNISFSSFRSELARDNEVQLFLPTLGTPLEQWENKIIGISNIRYSSIFVPPTNVPQSQDSPSFQNWSTLQTLALDTTPVTVRISQAENQPTPHLSVNRMIETDWNDNHHLNFDALFKRTSVERPPQRLPLCIEPSPQIMDAPIQVHSRLIDTKLRELHVQLKLEVTFSDLFLNLVNRLCWEFKTLLSEFHYVSRLFEIDDDDYIKVFKLLKLYAMSLQPPFTISDRYKTTPIVHLELFFYPLTLEDGKIQNQSFYLKHCSPGTELTPDRFTMIAYEYFRTNAEFQTRTNVVRDLEPPEPQIQHW
jgi:hypothetical protein